MDPTTLPLWKGLLSAPDARLLTFALVVVLPAVGYVRLRRLAAQAGSAAPARGKLVFYSKVILNQWLLVAATLVVALRHGLSLSALGERLGDARLTAAVTVGLLAIVAVASVIVRWRVRRARPEALAQPLGRMGKFAPAFGAEIAVFALLCATAGICEELLYRGWLLNMLRVAFVGLQLALLFVFVGSLIPGQFLHAAVDLLIGYAAALSAARGNARRG